MSYFKSKGPGFQEYLEAFKTLETKLGSFKSELLCCLWGESKELLYEAQEKLILSVEKQLGLSVQKIDLSDYSNPSDLEALLAQKDLFSTKRFFCLLVKNQDKSLETCLKLLKSRSWQPGVVLLCFPKASLASKLFKSLVAMQAFLIPCFSPKNFYEQKAYLEYLCDEFSLRLDSGAKKLIYEAYKFDVYETRNLIKQLSFSFLQQKKVLSSQDLQPFCDYLQEEQVFKISDFLLRLEYQKAEVYCLGLLRSGASLLSLTGVFAFHLRQATRFLEEKKDPLLKAKHPP
jgi:hypothetical protein